MHALIIALPHLAGTHDEAIGRRANVEEREARDERQHTAVGGLDWPQVGRWHNGGRLHDGLPNAFAFKTTCEGRLSISMSSSAPAAASPLCPA